MFSRQESPRRRRCWMATTASSAISALQQLHRIRRRPLFCGFGRRPGSGNSPRCRRCVADHRTYQSVRPILNDGFVEFDDDLYFAAFTGASNYGNVFQLDYRHQHPVRVDPSISKLRGEDGGFYVFNNKLYFNAFSNVLAKTRCSRSIQVPPHRCRSIRAGNPFHNSVPSAFHEFDGNLYFNEFIIASAMTRCSSSTPTGR